VVDGADLLSADGDEMLARADVLSGAAPDW